ncbi:hypothetical protein [Alteromonas lipotrueae]|uniref:hypothetical protein n=1 Tax=Alteromonas lipotrueae TaxID=2803814 RepID=UPI001C45DC28|nr:hypothetical protein [Alteromonas lipotrueae]
MRLEIISPNNQKRVAFMAESALGSYDPIVTGAPYYVGMFSDAIRQRGLSEQKAIAKNTIKSVLKGNRTYQIKIQIVECLMLFAYLCGWYGADLAFQQSLEKMQLKSSAA